MSTRAEREQAYVRQMREIIERDGWAVQGVFAVEATQINFAYTVGLTFTGLPELAVSGDISHQDMTYMLNACAQQSLTKLFEPGKQYNVKGLLAPVWAIEGPLTETGMGALALGQVPHVIQIVWPGENGALPGTPFWAGPVRQQLFGPAPWLNS